MCSLSTEGEDLRDQESVSRVLAELLDNQEGLFDSEDDDVSTTNDYSSINEQVLSVTLFSLPLSSVTLSLLFCIYIHFCTQWNKNSKHSVPMVSHIMAKSPFCLFPPHLLVTALRQNVSFDCQDQRWNSFWAGAQRKQTNPPVWRED